MNFHYFSESEERLFVPPVIKPKMNKMIETSCFNSALVIDNEDTDLFITSRMLVSKSIAKEIYTQKTIDSAIELIKLLETPPDLIFIDFISKDNEVIKFLRKFYHLPKYLTKDCKIIILSALLDYYVDEVNDALSFENVVMSMPKPLSDEQLKMIINLKPKK